MTFLIWNGGLGKKNKMVREYIITGEELPAFESMATYLRSNDTEERKKDVKDPKSNPNHNSTKMRLMARNGRLESALDKNSFE